MVQNNTMIINEDGTFTEPIIPKLELRYKLPPNIANNKVEVIKRIQNFDIIKIYNFYQGYNPEDKFAAIRMNNFLFRSPRLKIDDVLNDVYNYLNTLE